MEVALRILIDVILINGVIILFILFKFYIPNYISEKAKNLATKEDIADITKRLNLLSFSGH